MISINKYTDSLLFLDLFDPMFLPIFNTNFLGYHGLANPRSLMFIEVRCGIKTI